MLAREQTRQISIGCVTIGGSNPVAVQSMTNVAMKEGPDGLELDAAGNLAQIERLAQAGCEIARVAVPNLASVPAFGRICEMSPLPVVADIHFDHRIAIGAAHAGAAKLRINPGNIGGVDRVDAVIDAAGEEGIPIRIGVNGGSLDEKWRAREDLSLPQRLCASVCEHVEHFHERGFEDIVISTKASSVMECVEAYRLVSCTLPQIPLHLGITEAGTLSRGTVKSSVGMGILLSEGIGDTFRVSLTADPVLEVQTAWEILSACGLRQHGARLVSCPTCSRCKTDMIPIAEEVSRRLAEVRQPITVAVMGCEVNGPGEAADADIGVACGLNAGLLFKHGKKLRKVPADEIVQALFDEIACL